MKAIWFELLFPPRRRRLLRRLASLLLRHLRRTREAALLPAELPQRDGGGVLLPLRFRRRPDRLARDHLKDSHGHLVGVEDIRFSSRFFLHDDIMRPSG